MTHIFSPDELKEIEGYIGNFDNYKTSPTFLFIFETSKLLSPQKELEVTLIKQEMASRTVIREKP